MLNLDSHEFYINREFSWLSFNERVLEEANDPTNPLFERLRFLAITASNLDEFFMIRVAGLKEMVKARIKEPDNKSGLTPQEQLTTVSQLAHSLSKQIYQTFADSLLPKLEAEGLTFVKVEELNEEQAQYLQSYYHQRVYPVLTPMAVDTSRPFPHLLNRSLNIAVLLENNPNEVDKRFAVVQVPSVLPRFIRLPAAEGQYPFILLEDVICSSMDTLFPGNQTVATGKFRITRNGDLNLDEEGTDEDLLHLIQEELKRRKLGSTVRLEIAPFTHKEIMEILRESLELKEADIYEVAGPIDLTFLNRIAALEEFSQLRYEELIPQTPPDFVGIDDFFADIARHDLLLHHPFESFEPVERFLREAADDPQVLAIKQTLYRVSGDSPIIHSLERAAENGKQVTVLVELKARFDEANNIGWAKELEQAGCHVIYGLIGLKTHSKIALVVRSEGDQIRRYVHLSTGNYNDTTARLYTDVSMFTAREAFGEDATAFFNLLSGYSTVPTWNVFAVAPSGLRDKLLKLIEDEIQRSTPEHPGHLIAKMNSLTDKKLIKALYKASCAGVKIDLIIRGICSLRPGIPGVSETIRVISIVGRFLEHSRIFYFHNGGHEQLYLSSADWMTRNMEHRVEILFPVIQSNLKQRLKAVLHTILHDNVKSRVLNVDGCYSRVQQEHNEVLDSQLHFYKEAYANAKSEWLKNEIRTRKEAQLTLL